MGPPLSGVCRPHTLGDFLPALGFYNCDVILALQIEPELRPISKVPPKPNGCISGDRAAAIKDVGDAAGRHTQIK
jgi:hypothetical protein